MEKLKVGDRVVALIYEDYDRTETAKRFSYSGSMKYVARCQEVMTVVAIDEDGCIHAKEESVDWSWAYHPDDLALHYDIFENE